LENIELATLNQAYRHAEQALTQATIPIPKASVKPWMEKRNPVKLVSAVVKRKGCDRQSVRGKHPAHNDQCTSDCGKGDNDVQDCEGAH
jgi:hypothetical protein